MTVCSSGQYVFLLYGSLYIDVKRQILLSVFAISSTIFENDVNVSPISNNPTDLAAKTLLACRRDQEELFEGRRCDEQVFREFDGA